MKKLLMGLMVVLALVCCQLYAGEMAKDEGTCGEGDCGGCAPATPGAEHELLKQFEGTWNAKAKFMSMDGQGFEESEGKDVSKITLGGLWLETSYEGLMMGTQFTGKGLFGFDQNKQKYVSVWTDSMSSSLWVAEGTYDEKSKTLTLSGDMFCPMQKKNITMTQVFTFTSADAHTLTFSMTGPDGKDMAIGSIEYTRAK